MSPSLDTFWNRLVRGSRWTWVSDRHRDALPADLDAIVMDLRPTDRLHAKQGRSTARVRFHAGSNALSVYLKRHERPPWSDRLRALLRPAGSTSPAAVEWANLNHVRSRGVDAPEPVAAGEWVGPWGRLRSYLMIADLVGYRELNESLPDLLAALSPAEFARMKRALIAEMASLAARLHQIQMFHKDLYLCHFFLDERPEARPGRRLALIDLHRCTGEHGLLAFRWRWKDLGQLLYSTSGVPGIDDRDRLRFWVHYRRHLTIRWPRWQGRMIRAKAARYLAHNR